jgi:hypothetical protein
MAKDKKEKPQIRQLEDILGNPSDKSKLESFLDEAVRCKTRMADENEALKDLRETAKEDLGLDPKQFNQLSAIAFKNNFLEKQAEFSALDFAIEALFNKEGN